MPATERALRVTDAYRAQLLTLRARALRATSATWSTVTLDDLDGSFAAWRQAMTTLLGAGQLQGIRLSDAYLAAFLAAELGRPEPVQHTDAPALIGRGQDGRPLAAVLTPPLFTIRAALGRGRGAEPALRAGLSRATLAIDVEILAAPRTALRQGMTREERIIGYRRVTSGNACGACLGAATGAIHPSATALKVHGHCRCTKEPVVRGVRERHRRPTGRQIFDGKTRAEQDAMFAGRGGAEKAELIRSRRIGLEELVHPQPMATVPDLITEAPLSALRP
jgi:hypothetical protein